MRISININNTILYEFKYTNKKISRTTILHMHGSGLANTDLGKELHQLHHRLSGLWILIHSSCNLVITIAETSERKQSII